MIIKEKRNALTTKYRMKPRLAFDGSPSGVATAIKMVSMGYSFLEGVLRGYLSIIEFGEDFFGFEPSVYVGTIEFDIFGTDPDIGGAIATGDILVDGAFGITQIDGQVFYRH
jgi:hypothetical protein